MFKVLLEKRFTKANSVPTVEFIPCLAFQSQPKSNTFPIRRITIFTKYGVMLVHTCIAGLSLIAFKESHQGEQSLGAGR